MIETERLLLRPHIVDDFDAFKAMSQDAEVMRHIGRGPSTADEAWLRFLAHFGRWQIQGYGIFAVIEKETGQFIGDAGFSNFHRGLGANFDPFHEAAWVLSTAGQNKGYAFEAMTAAHIWLETQFKPKKTVCIIRPDNKPSIKLASKLGYQETGLGRFKDSDVLMFERTSL
ncbi:GNAT family N-acetyltransferase [Parasphingorhabdus cellanae]|uniref:GNAT family N-acetyltransferase n=1 Tax=Parasphingorhabdus cellanae TaxID=2806553 RepID=A0ABX7T8H1_9SPHN|nr:GNAT family N-acetyltransferase [Parasphingorhabdus cellanae]QTD57052.1 GNAT family N-acetyltransferase [Parasphingorhabdus cellanae]